MKKFDDLTIASTLLMIAGVGVQIGNAVISDKKRRNEIVKAVADYKAQH